ncbi:MAG: aminopeptidase P family protein [Candidatus Zixiibacteriota bacterium]|nr:MAG: aminopeptidase P family protein [candidate division Zixibacteria bacterium]
MNIDAIQNKLKEKKLDGWLMADFHARNEIAMKMLDLTGLVTRRSFYFIPSEGKPIGLVHAIERDKFENVQGDIITYSGYLKLEEHLKEILNDKFLIAMEYTEKGRLPYLGMVDAGTIELVRSTGSEIVSSADLVASFQARLTPEQIKLHHQAAKNILEIKDKAFGFIKERLSINEPVTEYEVSQFILKKIDEYNMVTEHSPICGVNSNAGNPHYEPTKSHTATIEKGQLVLIDLWGKIDDENGIFSDITWVCFTGTKEQIPDKCNKIFAIAAQARDKAVATVKEKFNSGLILGCDIDDACRKVIADSGYGEYFIHRTGHSITTDVHGVGPNVDNLETEDKRVLQEGHLFSIEPGIYLDDFGVRTEIDVLITPDGPEITTLPLQTEIIPLF